MAATMPRSSCEKPLASVSARSTCSCRRRTYASTSTERSTCSGSAWITARIDSPVRLITSARTRARPSTMTWIPAGLRAIWRMMPTVPIRRTSLGPGIVDLALLQDEQQHAIAAERAVDRFDRHRPVDGERLHAERKGDRAAERQHGQFGWQRGNGVAVDSGMASLRVFHRKCAGPSTRVPGCWPGPSRVSCAVNATPRPRCKDRRV